MTTSPEVSTEPRDETQRELVQAAASTYVGEAREIFTRINAIKESWFRQIFDDREWESFDWLDTQPSRQFSTLVNEIFRQLKQLDPNVQLPSQTETNDWFQLFTRQQELIDRGVPENLVPANRGASNALASLSKGVPEGQRYDTEAELLQKLELDPDQSVTAKAIKSLAPPKVPPMNVYDVVARQLSEINADSWSDITTAVLRLRSVLNQRGDLHERLATAKRITRGLVDLTLTLNTSAIAVIGDDGTFAGWAWARLKPNPKRDRSSGEARWLLDRYLLAAAIDGATESGQLPNPTSDDDVAHLLVTASEWERIDHLTDEIGHQLDSAALGVPLSTYQWWRDNGGAPVGTSWEGLNKRKADT